MSEEGNNNLTDEQLLKLSIDDIKSSTKYTADDRARWNELQNKERVKRFNNDPYSFVEVRDMVACVINSFESNMGIAVLIPPNVSRTKLNNAVEEIRRGADRMIMQMDIANQSNIIAANNLALKNQPREHGIINGARRMFKGG